MNQYDDEKTFDAGVVAGLKIMTAIAIALILVILVVRAVRAENVATEHGARVWLIVQWRHGGGTRRILDESRPTISECLREAGEVLAAAAEHDGDFEMVASCSVIQTSKAPA